VLRKLIPYPIKSLLLMACSFILIIACQPVGLQKSDESQVKPLECKVVLHKLGETCIPTNPQRIIALDPRYLADPLLALGIKPVGMAIYIDRRVENLAGLTADNIEGIENIGDVSQPSLEKIVSLKPDLILAMDFAHENIYQQLSAIAPTILIEYEKNYSFKKNLRYLAKIFDREVKASKILSQYQTRLYELREKLARKPQKIAVTVLVYHGGEFFISSTLHTSYEIFSDIGLISKTAPGDGGYTISLEVLSQYDSDILFIMNYDGKPNSFFLENPLIASLDAVKNNRVYFVSAEKWDANGPLGVNRILDDLFKYLPEKP
jgi:iron complex transport system substrate-binding protein